MKVFKQHKRNEFGQLIGLNVIKNSPVYFEAKTLHGAFVTLHYLNGENLTVAWASQIWQTVSTEPDLSCWTYLPYDGFDSEKDLSKNLQQNFNFPHSVNYLIEVNGKVVGWVALINQRERDQTVEIGNVYFSHLMKKSTASTEAIYLLLKTCFEQGFRRLEWKCDDLNAPPKNAAIRFGFSFEGMFRQDRINKGRNRNTAWYSILDEEWEALNNAYQSWLFLGNFDEQGQQKLRLQDYQAMNMNK